MKLRIIWMVVLMGMLGLGVFAQNTVESALPAGEYAWTIEVRCATVDYCKQAFGESPIPSWWESFSFIGHITSDGKNMNYYGSDIFRGRPLAGPERMCEAPFEKPFAGICIYGEKGEAFIKTSELPSPLLQGKPTLWIRNAFLHIPRANAQNYVTPCPCGAEGEDEQTPAMLGTFTTEDFFGGQKPAGVTVFTQLVKLP